MMKNVEVMMVKKEEVNGKMTKVIKMATLNEDVDNYVKFGSADKVKIEVKKKLRVSGLFGEYNVDDLWYKWDDFLKCWRMKRKEFVDMTNELRLKAS